MISSQSGWKRNKKNTCSKWGLNTQPSKQEFWFSSTCFKQQVSQSEQQPPSAEQNTSCTLTWGKFRQDLNTSSSSAGFVVRAFQPGRQLFTHSCTKSAEQWIHVGHPLIIFTQAVFANSAKLTTHDKKTHTHTHTNPTESINRIRCHNNKMHRDGNMESILRQLSVFELSDSVSRRLKQCCHLFSNSNSAIVRLLIF